MAEQSKISIDYMNDSHVLLGWFVPLNDYKISILVKNLKFVLSHTNQAEKYNLVTASLNQQP